MNDSRIRFRPVSVVGHIYTPYTKCHHTVNPPSTKASRRLTTVRWTNQYLCGTPSSLHATAYLSASANLGQLYKRGNSCYEGRGYTSVFVEEGTARRKSSSGRGVGRVGRRPGRVGGHNTDGTPDGLIVLTATDGRCTDMLGVLVGGRKGAKQRREEFGVSFLRGCVRRKPHGYNTGDPVIRQLPPRTTSIHGYPEIVTVNIN